MTLEQLKDHPGIMRDSATGVYLNIRDFRALDFTIPFVGDTTKIAQPAQDEVWILKSWSVLIHPWPKVISTSLIVRLQVNDVTLADVPLFAVARPLAQPDDQDIRERLAIVEKKLEDLIAAEAQVKGREPLKRIPAPEEQTNTLSDVLMNRNHQAWATMVSGPTNPNPLYSLEEFFSLIGPPKTFELRLCGLKREPHR